MKFSIVALATFATAASAFTPTSSFLGKSSASLNAVSSNGSNMDMRYKVAVIGGGPSGSCAAEIFAQEKGIDTVIFERKMDNAKPCGGAIPMCMVGEFDLPETVVDRKVCCRCKFSLFDQIVATIKSQTNVKLILNQLNVLFST